MLTKMMTTLLIILSILCTHLEENQVHSLRTVGDLAT
ncbi:hypothetical protein KP509_03G024100 [Ceratopteris richardii]|uniref:Uncharacterized protein n=1 Tax=Ceratopteris richardii TaxID=49495 RepID=A0A8T2V9P9_CERRI|nr:hypothetical protein KP509_03G024100 [Ceratopteris richardii]